MKSNTPMRQTWSAAVCALTLLALPTGTAIAAVPSTTAYHFSSHPMISGTVVTVNDHQMVVNTDQGEQVTLEVDSRTLAPRDLGPGMVMRAEFLALEDCHFYAQRIIPIRGGMSTNRLQAYANTRDSREAIARNSSGYRGYGPESVVSPASAERRETVRQTVGEHSPGTTMTATPATLDYLTSTRPMISGTVLAVNDHRLVVQTDQGQQVGMVMDSRTAVPSEVASGAVVRVEFAPMKDGRYYAKRVSRDGVGIASREQAYAHTRDSDFVIAQNTEECGCCVTAAMPAAVTSAVERRVAVVEPDLVVVQTAPAPVVEKSETLPETASNQPLTLVLGLLALGTAGLVTVIRGRKIS